MRKVITLLILLVTYTINAQNFCGKVIYKEEINFKYPAYIKTYETEFNNKACFTNCMTNEIAKNSKNKKQSEILKNYYAEKGIEHKTEFVKNKNRFPYYYLTKKNTYFAEFLDDINLYVKESPFQWNWKLVEETKKIGKYTCKKATIRFRKRNFIAWYTPDIPASFGPKKFKGLPGLILRIHDVENLWSISAVEVKINTKKKCIFNKKDINKFKKTINIVTYLKERDQEYKRYLIRYATKHGVVGRKTPFDNYHARSLYNGSKEEIFDKYPLKKKKRK